MDTLSASYAKTTELLAEKKKTEAAQEFRTGVGAVVRRIYTQVASTAPQRFESLNADEWTDWGRKLYSSIRQVEDVLTGREKGDVAKLLGGLREHFYVLHEKSGTRKANDYIYAFQRGTQARRINAGELVKLKAKVETAKASRKALGQVTAYDEAKSAWESVVDPILADGKIQFRERNRLRKASETFYRQFGIQFE